MIISVPACRPEAELVIAVRDRERIRIIIEFRGYGPMDTDQLARHYDTFSARERFALLVAARVRGDDIEAERLIESAPREVWRVPHHQDLAEVLCDLALLHLARLLDAAALLWRADSLQTTNESSCKPGKVREARDLRLLATMRRLATRIVVLREAWRQFCAELQIDSEVLLQDLPGYATVQLTAEAAKTLALQPAEAVAVAEYGVIAEVTVEGVLADYRATLSQRTGTAASGR
jgi:hypothetical protein